MAGFRKFMLQGNIISLAVAVVIGVAFNAIVQALVTDMITPLITAIAGDRASFPSLSFQLNHATFTYGAVINAVLSFVVIAAVIYWLVVAPANKLTALAQRNKAATDRPCPECLATIPVAARRCMYCTSELSQPVVPSTPGRPALPGPRRARHGYPARD
jgi:large conductance mechanosensitive channel